VERQGSDYVLAIDLPFASKENIELTQKDAELFVRVGPHRRDISLPRVLARRRSRGARFEGNTLRIFFASEAGAASKGGS